MENNTLKDQLQTLNENHEISIALKVEMDDKYANIEEAMEDKLNEFACESRPEL